MEDPGEHLIRRALGRHRPPALRPTLADDVLRRLALSGAPAGGARPRGRARLVVPWLAVLAASAAVLAHLPWPSGARTAVWALALALVPLGYWVALWPAGARVLVTACGGVLCAAPREAAPAAHPEKPGQGASGVERDARDRPS